MNASLLALFGYFLSVLLMLTLWLVQRRWRNAGIVDAGWTVGVGTLAVAFAALSPGDFVRRVVIMSVAALWSFRLGFHLIRRLLHEPEDRRYVAMKAAWGGSAQSKLFQFYQYQAAACVFFAIPALIGSQSKVPFGLWSDYAGILIAIVALTGEAIADRQLAAHRAGRSTNGNGLATVCQLGLWRYSRHPNYFFEWLYWWSYVGLAVSSSWGWLTLMAPLLMYHFIVHVTGIPPTEEHLLNTRGESYRRYQEETSSFFPWFPRGLDRSR